MGMRTSPLLAGVMAAAAFLAGCAAPGYQRADSAGTSMAETSSALDRAGAQVDADLAALDAIVAARRADPRPAFEAFSRELDRTAAAAESTRSRTDALRAQAEHHFQAWVKESETINDPDLKQAANARRTEARKSFGAMTTSMERVKAAYEPFILDLKDLRTALGSDLTAGGIDAAGGAMTKARGNGKKLKDAIADAQHALADFRAQLVSPQAPAPAPVPEK